MQQFDKYIIQRIAFYLDVEDTISLMRTCHLCKNAINPINCRNIYSKSRKVSHKITKYFISKGELQHLLYMEILDNLKTHCAERCIIINNIMQCIYDNLENLRKFGLLGSRTYGGNIYSMYRTPDIKGCVTLVCVNKCLETYILVSDDADIKCKWGDRLAKSGIYTIPCNKFIK